MSSEASDAAQTFFGHVGGRILLSQQERKKAMSKKGRKGGGRSTSLGRSLIKDRNKSNRRFKDAGEGWVRLA